jgi:hypothetical protein
MSSEQEQEQVEQPVDSDKPGVEAIESLEGARKSIKALVKSEHDTIAAALVEYKAGNLPRIGKVRVDSYTMSASLGGAGLLSALIGAGFLIKGKTGLGAAGLGVGAGFGVGAAVTYPIKKEACMFFLRCDCSQTVEIDGQRQKLPLYAKIVMPLKLSDKEFKNECKRQLKKAKDDKKCILATPIEIEIVEEAIKQAAEVASALPIGDGPPILFPSSSSNQADEPKLELLDEGEEKEPLKPAKPVEAGVPAAVETRTTEQIKRDAIGSGVFGAST